jgi:lysophospholipase L1-like esterase
MRTKRLLGIGAVFACLFSYPVDHALAGDSHGNQSAGNGRGGHGEPCGRRHWLPAWGARGPLSTTITTSTTFTERVPTLSGSTMRIMAHLTAGGSQVRVRFSQRFSTVPLVIDSAHVAIRSADSAIVPETDRELTFGGVTSLLVPAGGDIWSDPVRLDTNAGDDLAISFYVSGTFVPTTYAGRGTTKTSYYQLGNHVAEASLPGASRTKFVLGAFEAQVLAHGPSAALVALGDSITEGAVSTADANGSWPDLLAARMPQLPDGTTVSVINAGIGSGRFITSNGAGLCGLSRLNELLSIPQLRWVTLLMGVNDISYELATPTTLENAYAIAISEAHAAGKKIIGIPILPFGGSVKDAGNNKLVAQEVNAWIRAHDRRLGGPEPSFDAVIDLEPVVIDPSGADWAMNPLLVAPDKVHPNQAGYTAIANAIPLEIFSEDDDAGRGEGCHR